MLGGTIAVKSAYLVACAAAAAALFAVPARADVPAAVTTALADKYKLTYTAILSGADKDVKAAFAELAPDYVETDLQGKTQNRDEVLASAEQQMKTFHGTSCDEKIDSAAQPDANTIVATVTQHIDGQVQAPDGNHDITSTQKSQDTWKLENGTWEQTASKALRTLLKIDGKVVQDDGQ